MLRIEFEEPRYDKCECCGNTTTRLTRFVYLDDYAHAVYYVMFTDGHEDKVAYTLIGLGEWGEESTPAERTAFSVKIWIRDEKWAVTVTDREESPWSHTDYLGEILNRDEALDHPMINDVYHITDHIVLEDIPVINYFTPAN